MQVPYAHCIKLIFFRLVFFVFKNSLFSLSLRQFIVNLDGDVEVEVSSGEKRVLCRGQVFFVEDLTGGSCT